VSPFIDAARCLFLGFLLMAIGLSPASLQRISDLLFDFVGRISPEVLDLPRPRIQSQTSWWLVALGGAWVAATFVAYLFEWRPF
jgi:hypothetical protein